jgi:hypothetical protein
MSLIAEIRRVDGSAGEKLRVDLLDCATHKLAHSAARVDATDVEEARVRDALRVLAIEEKP